MNTETKHTPWRWLDEDTLVEDVGRRNVVLTAKELLTRDPETGLLVRFDPDSDIGRKIEAAPDLLALLKELVPDLAWGTTGRWKGDKPDHARLLAAIAKAEGRA